MPAPRLRLAAVLASLLMAAAPAWAGDNPATSKAFDALLSLPQTQPEEGEWQHSAPAGFDSQQEGDLIRWLTRQKQAGADLTATRHDGTLLHHAIRGGLDATARWLLANGADPLQPLAGDHQQPDALAIAIQYRRWSVMETLLTLPALNAPGRARQWRMAWEAAQGKDEHAVVARLMARKLPLPGGAEGAALLTTSLQRQWFKLALALSAAGAVQPQANARPVWGIPASLPFPGADLETLDSRLTTPVLPFALPLLASSRDVDLLFTLRLRRPFEDAAFSRGIVQGALDAHLAPPLMRALLGHMPRAAVRTAFDDGDTLAAWMRWTRTLTNSERAWALEVLSDLPARQPARLLAAMVKNTSWYDEHTADAPLAAAWGQVLARLQAPLPASVNGTLWMFVPQQHRATLLRLGYRPTMKELERWFDDGNANLIRPFLPQLKAVLPEFSARIHEGLLAPLSVDAEQPCTVSLDDKLLAKARLLLDAGAKPRTPVTLDAGCRQDAQPGVLAFLEKAGMVAAAPPAVPGRFQRGTPACRFRPSPAWRSALTQAPGAAAFAYDSYQVLAVPGEADCALLVSGGSAGGREHFDEDSFTGTQHFSPCTDGDLAAQLWRVVGGRLVRSEAPAIDSALELRDTRGGRELLLAGGNGLGGCGQVPHFLLEWGSGPGGVPALHPVARNTPVMQAFLQQCGPQLAACPELDLNSESAPPATGPAFEDRHWAAERQAYLGAVLALDAAALRTQAQAGIFPGWTFAAIEAVTKADLPLAEKRRRTAWLFRDAGHLGRALANEGRAALFDGLLAWLPAQDWGPLIKAYKGQPDVLERLRDSAAQQGKTQLACRLSTALGQACGSARTQE